MASTCTNCGFNNPPGMRFCGNCGARLPEQPARPEPGPSAPAVDPASLGVMTGADLLERFKQAGLEASGQRRSVTVLFVDLSGYTRLAEQLGDEDLYELVQKFLPLLINDVYKYEGMVDKLTGDGLMALFGAPIAHENNAERALRSAIDMLDDVARLGSELDLGGADLQIHLGLNAGSVIVGGLGGDGLMNYTAIGDSVNLARRLEESAGPGTILVSESVYRQTYRLFDFEALPPLSLKNVSHEVTAYRVVGPKERPGLVRGLEGLRAPMIGREREFRQVQSAIQRLVYDRQGGLVLLVGEGGMGKSRLTSEIKAGLDYSRLRVLEGHSLTYRKAIPYWIFQDMLRGYLGGAAAAPESEVRRRRADYVLSALRERPGSSERAAIEKVAYLEYMFSMEPSDPQTAGRIAYLDASQIQQQIFLAVRDLLLAEAAQRPLLIILEDLHWADDASLGLLRFLIDSARSAPLLIYAISRPFEGGAVQALHERAAQRLADRYLHIRLQALPPDQSAQLLQALLSIEDLPESLRAQIIERSAGLPFYLEEILRMLIENRIIYRSETGWHILPGADASAIGVPDTIQGLILTRVDRLTPAQRRVLQTASVVGYQFNRQVLFHVLCAPGEQGVSILPEDEARDALDLLVEREYIVSQSGSAEDIFMFKHVLVSDAVYSTLLQRDRRDLHTRAGQAVEAIYAGRLDSQIEVLASHFLRGVDLDRALHYLTLAGQKAAQSYANDQARQYFTQALEILPRTHYTPPQAVDVYVGLGDALLTSGDYPQARDFFNRGLEELGGRAGTGSLVNPSRFDPAQWAERRRLFSLLQRRVGRTHEGLGDYDKALACLRVAQLTLDTGSEFDGERANILNDIGWIDFRRGNFDQAEAMLQEALRLSEAAGQLDVVASVLNRLAGIYFQRDAVDQASRYLVRSLELREQIGDVVAVARSRNNLGLVDWKQGNLTGALENFNQSYKLQASLGDVEGLIVLNTNMGLIELDRGNLETAEKHFQEALDSAGQIGHSYHVYMARMHLALLNVYAGSWRKVTDHALAGLAGFQELGVQENLVDLYVMLGWAYRGLGDTARLQDAEALARELVAQERERSEAPSEGQGRALRLFGRLDRDRGDNLSAREALRQSADLFGQLGSQSERGRSLVDLADLALETGEYAQARVLLDEARQVFVRCGARLELERVDQIERKFPGKSSAG